MFRITFTVTQKKKVLTQNNLRNKNKILLYSIILLTKYLLNHTQKPKNVYIYSIFLFELALTLRDLIKSVVHILLKKKKIFFNLFIVNQASFSNIHTIYYKCFF